jgi:hypothetical protein
MTRIVAIGLTVICLTSAARAQTPPPTGMTDNAKAVLGSWEFSNADRDKICTATLKPDPVKVGFKVEFDANCAALFPLVADVAGWIYPENDLLRLVDSAGRSLVEFSEVEDRIFEAPTPGVGVLFLQNASAAAGVPAKTPDQVAGNWAITKGEAAKPVCQLGLTMTAAKDNFVLSVKPGCDQTIVRLNFTQWRLDRGELLLLPARGNSWRFESVDDTTWRRLPESADQIQLVRQ